MKAFYDLDSPVTLGRWKRGEDVAYLPEVMQRAGEAYVDVGTLHGYREATRLLESRGLKSPESTPRKIQAPADDRSFDARYAVRVDSATGH